MSRTNVYATLRGADGSERALGGRRNHNEITAWLNTDNATHSDCGIEVSAEVVGSRSKGEPHKIHQCGNERVRWEDLETRLKQTLANPTDRTLDYNILGAYIDRSGDIIKCPHCGKERGNIDTRQSVFTVGLPPKGGCVVYLKPDGHKLHELAKVGAGLVAMQGLCESNEKKVETAVEILDRLEASYAEELPDVRLPGDISMAHALACVQIVAGLREGKGN